MLRSLVCLLCLASSAEASTITLDYGVKVAHYNHALPIPRTLNVQLTRAIPGDYNSVATEWIIPNVTPADVGRTWTLNAANAASYGFDWSLLETAALSMDSLAWDTPDHWRLTGGAGYYFPSGLYGIHAGTRPRITNLDRLEMTLHEFYSNPASAIISHQHRLIGDGEWVPIPEPASWLMLLVGLHISMVRRSRI